jgi:hypothetical protein
MLEAPEACPPAPEAPAGYRWAYRGIGWQSRIVPVAAAFWSSNMDYWSEIPSGY